MHLDSNNIKKYLETLDKNSSPKWGVMSSSQMLFHCNSFIDVTLGYKKINFITKQVHLQVQDLEVDVLFKIYIN